MVRFSRADRVRGGSIRVCCVPAKFLVNLQCGLVMILIVLGKDSFPIILDITCCDLRFVENIINLFFDSRSRLGRKKCNVEQFLAGIECKLERGPGRIACVGPTKKGRENQT